MDLCNSGDCRSEQLSTDDAGKLARIRDDARCSNSGLSVARWPNSTHSLLALWAAVVVNDRRVGVMDDASLLTG
jgi:hypothetical protein